MATDHEAQQHVAYLSAPQFNGGTHAVIPREELRKSACIIRELLEENRELRAAADAKAVPND